MIIIYALIGLVVGGVINYLADILPRRRSRPSGWVCLTCGQPRPKIQLLAIAAYLTGKRRCPACQRAIPIRNLIAELGTAALFGLLYLQPRFANPVVLVLASFHTSVLILLTITDLEHRRIPNKVILPAIVIAAVTSPLLFYTGWYWALLGGAIGYGFFWLAAVIGGKAIGRGALGGGDVKLAAFVGLITGLPGVITALIVTILVGGLISAVLLLVRVVNLRSGIPYGPFLVIGGFVTMVWGQQIMTRFFWGA